MRLWSLLVRTLLPIVLLFTSGCFQLETIVKLHEDGSATITERFRVSQYILEIENSSGIVHKMSDGLKREAVMERLQSMGSGISLISHETHEVNGGHRESVSVFKIKDATEFRYASPYIAFGGYRGQCMMKGKVEPRLYTDNYNPPGYAYFSFVPETTDPAWLKDYQEKERARERSKDSPPKVPTPLEQQVLRQIQPIVQDMLRGFLLRFTFECYAPLYAEWGAPGVRNGSSNTQKLDMIDVSDKNLDLSNLPILENEEIMLELMQLQFNGPNLRNNMEGYVSNLVLPLLRNRQQAAIFKPSRPIFDKIYAGQSIDFNQRNGGKRAADFNEIGWKPPTVSR